jgi:hypothetical protein
MRAPSLLAPRLRCLVYLCLLVAAILAYSAHFVLRAQSRSKTPPSNPRIDLHPKLVAGEVLRYQVQLQTVTDTKRSGAVSDPQGPSRLTVTWDATVRMEVLGQGSPWAANSQALGTNDRRAAGAGPNASGVPMRIRTTYEHSAASVKSESPDPQAEDIEQSYNRLEGQMIEFTVGADGHISDVHGLEAVLDNDQVRQAAEQWMAQVSGPAIPPQGVALGQTWNSAQPATSMPLAGMMWRSNSSYVRNEPCRPAESIAAGSPRELCAVILTRQSVVPQKQLRDPTPEDYRRNGLHTSGRWSGSGEGLSYVSLQTRSAVSVTQDSFQQIDFTVTNSSGRSIRYAGTVETHTRIALLPPEAPDFH